MDGLNPLHKQPRVGVKRPAITGIKISVGFQAASSSKTTAGIQGDTMTSSSGSLPTTTFHPQQQRRVPRRKTSASPDPFGLTDKHPAWALQAVGCILVAWIMTLLLLHSSISLPRRFSLPLPEDNNNEQPPDDHSQQAATTTTLRERFEATHDPNAWPRITGAVNDLRLPATWLSEELLSCPVTPPPSSSYPQTWPLVEMLQHWNPNNVDIPKPTTTGTEHLYHGLCVLDWNKHSAEQIEAYRKAEIPFVLQNHPEVLRAAERWNSNVTTAGAEEERPYLLELLRNEPAQRNEFAKQSNHMPFWRAAENHPIRQNPPTQNVELTVREWWQHARHLEAQLRDHQVNVTAADHYYFRFSATQRVHTYLYNELPIFDPRNAPSLFMVDPTQERGINCRFGMVGNMADNHFDPTRNWIVVLGGRRRYILAPPEACPHLDLHPLGHPSARHSRGNWGDPQQWTALQHAQALQVVLQAGDALYLPTSWFHFIVSLTTSFQCNARSGTTQTIGSPLYKLFEQCGFAGMASGPR